jgi:hypothetical protein
MRDDVEFLCKLFVFNPKDLTTAKPEASQGDGETNTVSHKDAIDAKPDESAKPVDA